MSFCNNYYPLSGAPDTYNIPLPLFPPHSYLLGTSADPAATAADAASMMYIELQ